MYIQAAAAGISDEEYGKLTLTKTLARIEAAQLNRYWQARPIVTAMLPHLSDESLKSIVKPQSSSGKKTLTGRALDVLLSDYLPLFMRTAEKQYNEKAKPVPSLPKAAAQGIVQSFARGDFSDSKIWAGISRYYPSIAATARKRGGG